MNTLDTYEDVSSALDAWFSERPGLRTCMSGKMPIRGYFARLSSRGETDIVARSSCSSNDAIALALQEVYREETQLAGCEENQLAG